MMFICPEGGDLDLGYKQLHPPSPASPASQLRFFAPGWPLLFVVLTWMATSWTIWMSGTQWKPQFKLIHSGREVLRDFLVNQ